MKSADHAQPAKSSFDLLAEFAEQLSEELQRSLADLQRSISNLDCLYDYKQCTRIGDIWIHLKCVAAKIRDFLTTNYRDSIVLCPALELEMKLP
jgi:hypothetical protein